ncbi:MAG: DUF2726 domain-containing protein [Verrucomicrobiota bacterium]
MPPQNQGCFFILITCLRKIFGLTPPRPPYRPARFLSQSELAFYHSLKTALEGSLTICAKVRVADVLETLKTEGHRVQFNRICAKHFDFVLCTPQDMRPVAFVELDDSSHLLERARKSDALKDGAAEQAGIPLFRFPVRKTYHSEEIRKILIPFFPRNSRSPRRWRGSSPAPDS